MQSRLRDYFDDLNSFEHNIFNFGKNPPGRYIGFDVFQSVGGMGFTLAHSSFQYKDLNANTVGPIGILITPEGVKIMEDQPITGLVLDTNAGNAADRYDLVVCNHQYATINGGQPATYSIIKGPLNSPNKPLLTDTFHQVIIGTVKIPAGAIGSNACKYVKERCPDSGDGPDARLNEVNRFEKLQQFAQHNKVYTVAADSPINDLDIIGKWDFQDDGNLIKIVDDSLAFDLSVFRFLDVVPKDGTHIQIFIDGPCRIVQDAALDSQDFAKGYRKIIIADPDVELNLDGGRRAFSTEDGRPILIDLILISGDWYVTNIKRFVPRPPEIAEDLKIIRKGTFFFGDATQTDTQKHHTFPDGDLPDSIGNNYIVIGQWRSIGADFNFDDDIGGSLVRNLTKSGFDVIVRELSAVTQSLYFDYIIVALA